MPYLRLGSVLCGAEKDGAPEYPSEGVDQTLVMCSIRGHTEDDQLFPSRSDRSGDGK